MFFFLLKMISLLSSLLIKHHIRTIRNLIYIAKKKEYYGIHESSKGQNRVSLVGNDVGEDGGAGGGGTGALVRIGDILILLGFLVGELGEF